MTFNGEDALAKIDVLDPQVVLLDVLMPGLTGDELVKMIKNWKPEIKVIMLSSALTPEIITTCLENGAYACVDKAENIEVLGHKIYKSLGDGLP